MVGMEGSRLKISLDSVDKIIEILLDARLILNNNFATARSAQIPLQSIVVFKTDAFL